MSALHGDVLSESELRGRVCRSFLAAEYRFAKTMPENPHWYTLRKNWSDDAAFCEAVQYIRDNGYIEIFKKSKYTMFNLNGMKYWTMGAPINEKDGGWCTILINRAAINEPSDYDLIAYRYDTLFIDGESRRENVEVIDMIGAKATDRVLDIGCGTGLFVDYRPLLNYLGIDPSAQMLAHFAKRHPEYQDGSLMNARFEDFYDPKGFDLIISLFGAANYIDPAKWVSVCDLLRPGGRLFAMFYAERYLPVTYEKCGIAFPYFQTSEYDLSPFDVTLHKDTYQIIRYQK